MDEIQAAISLALEDVYTKHGAIVHSVTVEWSKTTNYEVGIVVGARDHMKVRSLRVDIEIKKAQELC